MSSWTTYKRLLRYTIPYKTAMVVGVVGFLIYAQTQWIWAELIKYIFSAIDSGDQTAKNLIAVAIMVIFLVRGIGSFLGSYGVAYVARKVVHDLRVELFRQLLSLSPSYFDQHASGRVLSKITYNVEQVAGSSSEALKIILQEGLIVIGLMVYLIYSHWKLSLLFVLIFPLIGWVVRYASRRLNLVSQRIQDSMGDVTHIASEALNGFNVVKLYGGGPFERQRFDDASQNNLKQSMKLVVTQSINTPVVQCIVSIAMSAMVWVALQPQLFGDTSAADFIAYLTAAGLMVKPIRQLTQVNGTIQRGIAGARSIFELMDEPRERDEGGQRLSHVRGELAFHEVCFEYPLLEDKSHRHTPAAESDDDAPSRQDDGQQGQAERDHRVLKEITLTIKPGEMVAFVGRSGAGKSTLASLIPRFYDPTSGTITLDGVPIEALSLSHLREQVAMVTQEVALFNATIAHNIAYGTLEGATPEEIRAAAEDANALEFIDALPDGMNTLLGEEGVQLSGGQRQRLAIARALLKNAPLLILDEATSALDNASERIIQTALERVMQNRTTLVIAHRLSTIEAADTIVVMDQGRIVEVGTHKALLAQGGIYTELQSTFNKTQPSKQV